MAWGEVLLPCVGPEVWRKEVPDARKAEPRREAMGAASWANAGGRVLRGQDCARSWNPRNTTHLDTLNS